jgi:hypothetical protein
VNSTRIASNANNITANAAAIDLNRASISSNTDNILRNMEDIDDIKGGLATVAALPTVVLPQGHKVGVSGGFGFYGGKTGFGVGVAARASENVAFGASLGGGDGETSGKVSVTWSQ